MNCHNFNHHCADFSFFIKFLGGGGRGGESQFPPLCMKLWLVYMCGLCVCGVCVYGVWGGVCVVV